MGMNAGEEYGFDQGKFLQPDRAGDVDQESAAANRTRFGVGCNALTDNAGPLGNDGAVTDLFFQTHRADSRG